ncbi:MAG: ParB/RepB/Spo0J family partition protein [Ruminococcus sp.]|nr:ParB/RepB/Spo0J family partition protein [Ruminococcus sp.]
MTYSIARAVLERRAENRGAFELEIGEILPGRAQPRTEFDVDGISSLAKSIASVGILQPLVVRRVGEGYELVCGERRLRAAKMAGLSSVPCVMAELSDSGAAVAALAENLQRESLNCFEQAQGIETLITQYGMTQQRAAVALGLSQSAVANKLRLLKIAQRHREIILENALTERHARALLKADEGERDEVLREVADKRLTVQEMERLIDDRHERERIRRSYRRRAAALGDVRLFFNTVERALSIMRLAGVEAQAERFSADGYMQYVIKIPERGGEFVKSE